MKTRTPAFLISLFTFAVILSCGDDDTTTGPATPEPEPYKVRLLVVDTAGNPVPGIRVSAYTDFEIYHTTGNRRQPSTALADPGDVNCNGIAYETADANALADYFVEDTMAFAGHAACSIENSDVNEDGIPLTLLDLIQTIRVKEGVAMPGPVVIPDSVDAQFTQDAGNLRLLGENYISCVYIATAGECVPELQVGGLNLHYGFDGEDTHIVVWPQVPTGIIEYFRGMFLSGVDSTILAVEAVTPDGAPVRIAMVESAPVEVFQNYPNPTDDLTEIFFNLPGGGDWRIDFYNLEGDTIDSYTGGIDAGSYLFTWDASDEPTRLISYCVTVTNADTTFTSEPRYIVRWTADPERTVLGFANSGGILYCRDSTAFPYLIDKPPLEYRALDYYPMGAIVFQPEMTFTLVDTALHHRCAQTVPVTDTTTSITLTWDPL